MKKNESQKLSTSRQIAFWVLAEIDRKSIFSDVALDNGLQHHQPNKIDRKLIAELVYGCVRQRRSLDTIVDGLARKKSDRQPRDLRLILHIGLYQLCYLDRIPESAAVNTTVELAKQNNLAGLAGFVNGILRQYLRVRNTPDDPLKKAIENPIERLGIVYSYPNWIVENWLEQIGLEETEKLCKLFNRSPALHLRINPLKTTIDTVESALKERGIQCDRSSYLPQGLKLTSATGEVKQLPGFNEGWWTIQDGSAQLASYLLDPQPDETIVDACAAPGGKTTHIAELMGDRGKIWAIDRVASRLKKVRQNIDRLQLNSIEVCQGDSRDFPQLKQQCDRVLLDAPCSGLGTLHRRADLRWRQTPQMAEELAILQGELLEAAATWLKPGGVLVYATCTLHPPENEGAIGHFLDKHPHWKIDPPSPESLLSPFVTPAGWLEVWPTRHHLDGFFMVRLKHDSTEDLT
ncbi:16S rRNA (cytosine(967)-C(5))-methyltransferase [Oscillatoriales cyanobacterium LEGE 11467]|uniref:16S rRNA (cytosine(967)-C(5))-methyltransferase n=1 Tax=Zarconia navalis LEGE 11467 TaxID=1828826 RepID=A0A928Z8I7_9CYAN|nr:16S rRNA (cytosine(967)-C(5))-methyltransferase [Zarconia navalis]MBE9042532.1 16S rRNA (cytosine(967)-C(5))-methyltransferase [Zarconia navalis LEGE 11467]